MMTKHNKRRTKMNQVLNCNCTNCECTHCGWQNPKELIGEAAKKANVQPWDKQWFCEPECVCCPKDNKPLVLAARKKEAKIKA